MLIDFFLKLFNFRMVSDVENTFVLIQVYPSSIIDSEICCPNFRGDASLADINKSLMPKVTNRLKIDAEGDSFMLTVNVERKRVQLLFRKLFNIGFDVSVADPVFIKFRDGVFNALPFFYEEEDREIYETEDYSSTKIVISIFPEWG